jgi:hypothetical protein
MLVAVRLQRRGGSCPLIREPAKAELSSFSALRVLLQTWCALASSTLHAPCDRSPADSMVSKMQARTAAARSVLRRLLLVIVIRR